MMKNQQPKKMSNTERYCWIYGFILFCAITPLAVRGTAMIIVATCFFIILSRHDKKEMQDNLNKNFKQCF